MNQLTPFQFKDHPVRTVLVDGDIRFAAADVAKALEYRDASDMTRHIDEEDKGYTEVRTPGGKQRMLVINESGVYAATFRSRKPSANAFRRWVTSEVLPSIRRTGSYQMPDLSSEMALAVENGHLKDQVRAQDEIIKLKDGAIMGLQGKLIGVQDKQIRLIGQMAAIEKRQRIRETIQTIERMVLQGHSRDEIALATGKSLNYIRQYVFRLRKAGRLPMEGGEA